MIGAKFAGFETLSLTLILGIFLGGIPEAAASATMLRKAGYSDRTIFLLWSTVLVTGVVAAFAGKLFINGSEFDGGRARPGVAGGAILALVTHAMIPEALHKGVSDIVLPAVGGFLFALYLALDRGAAVDAVKPPRSLKSNQRSAPMDKSIAKLLEPINEPSVIAAPVYALGRQIADIAIDEAVRRPSGTVMSSGSVCSNPARSYCNAFKPSSILTRWPSKMPEKPINNPSWSSTATRCSSWRGRPRSRRADLVWRDPHLSSDEGTSFRYVTAHRPHTPPSVKGCEACPTVLAHGEDYILYAILDFIGQLHARRRDGPGRGR